MADYSKCGTGGRKLYSNYQQAEFSTFQWVWCDDGGEPRPGYVLAVCTCNSFEPFTPYQKPKGSTCLGLLGKQTDVSISIVDSMIQFNPPSPPELYLVILQNKSKAMHRNIKQMKYYLFLAGQTYRTVGYFNFSKNFIKLQSQYLILSFENTCTNCDPALERNIIPVVNGAATSIILRPDYHELWHRDIKQEKSLPNFGKPVASVGSLIVAPCLVTIKRSVFFCFPFFPFFFLLWSEPVNNLRINCPINKGNNNNKNIKWKEREGRELMF